MDEILAFLAFGIVEVVFIKTGGLVVRAVSLGRWRGEAIGAKESRIFAPAGALSFRQSGTRVVTRSGLFLAGIAFYLIGAVVAAAVFGL